MRKKGKLIVIDGSDGSGKATQTKLLVSRLKKDGHTVRTLDFPGYERNLFGKLIGECLTGKRGDFGNFDPRIASTLYAADRFESKAKIEKWLQDGHVVILDRYVSANQMHQGGKIKDIKKRKEFLVWLDDMEFGVFKLPRPNAIIYLSVPVKVSLNLLKRADQKKKKSYAKGGRDVMEDNVRYLENARKSAESIVKSKNKWHRIDCVSKGDIQSREDIHERVYDVVRKIVK